MLSKINKAVAKRPRAAVHLQSLITRLDLKAIARAAEKQRAQQTTQRKIRRKRMADGVKSVRNATPPRQLVDNTIKKSGGDNLTDTSTQKSNVRKENTAANQNDGKRSVSVVDTLSAIDNIIRRAGVWDMIVHLNRVDSKDVI